MYPLASISLRTELSINSLGSASLALGISLARISRVSLIDLKRWIRNLKKIGFHVIVALFQQLAVRDSGMLGQDAERKLLVRFQNLCPLDHRHEKLFRL